MSLCTGIRGVLVNTASWSSFSIPSCSSIDISYAQVDSRLNSSSNLTGCCSASTQCHLGRSRPSSLSWVGRDSHGRVEAEAAKSYQKFRVYCEGGSASGAVSLEEWTKRLPSKRKALYSHSLPCIEAWLRSLGFYQNKEDRSIWIIERPDWHAQLSLDITDLYIRYLKTGPGNLERDIERKFSYALSREDLENAILGGP
ncbi:hypothetical protein Mapa_005009 [Marchantia paleacea]|nr:hypothetical protein Mapa_005009 [Marchantia paleacea]